MSHRLGRLFYWPIRPQLKQLYVFSLLFALAESFVLIFEPVFFFQQGIPLATIALYYAIHYTLYVVVLPLGGMFAARFGVQPSLALSTPLFIFYFLALASIPHYPHLLWIALLLLTAHKILYWPAYHADFAEFGDKKSLGKELSWMNLVVQGIGILGPLCGGFIATFLGFPTLFMSAAATALIAGVVLILRQYPTHHSSMSFYRPWQILGMRSEKGMVVSMFGMGEDLMNLVFWPIFMFIVIGTAASLGIVAAFATAFMTFIGFFIGNLIDRHSRRTVMRASIPFLVLSHLFRPFAGTPVLALTTDTFARTALIAVRIPMLAQLYLNARSVGTIPYLVAFEMALAIGKACFAWIMVALFLFLAPSTAFTIGFLMAALFSWLYVAL